MNDNSTYSNIGKGDMRLFETLILEYSTSLNSYVFRLINDRNAAEDIVQDVFVGLWVNRRKINFDIPVSGYLYTAARNAALNFLKKSKRYRSADPTAVPFEAYADSISVEEEADRMLSAAIAKLPPRTAEVILLSLEGKSQAEIAKEMDVTVSNVKNLKSQGIKRLRNILGPMFLFIAHCHPYFLK